MPRRSIRAFLFAVACLIHGEFCSSQTGAEEPEAKPDFVSSYLAVSFDKTSPAFSWFDTDSLGGNRLTGNVVLSAKLPDSHATLEADGPAKFHYAAPSHAISWEVELSERRVLLRSRFVEGEDASAFLLLIDQHQNHATLLGQMTPQDRRIRLPCILHLPDRGTFRVGSDHADATLEYDARRRQPENFVRIAFPPATRAQETVAYTLDATLIYPDSPGVADDPRYDGYRRNFLNLLQWNPRLRTLANNASSDVCGFCFWQYAELAAHAPDLAPGLTALDLVQASVDRVLDGGLTYGQRGYDEAVYPEAAPWDSETPCDSLDTLPSLLIAACRCIEGDRNPAWGQRRFDRLVAMGRTMLAEEHDGSGLIEYPLSGNAGCFTGKRPRPANWWDTIGFGHEDAYSNALAYHACTLLGGCARQLGKTPEADEFEAAARTLKAAYYPTFHNPQTGVLAGWKSADGKLHDYYFTFVSGLAVSLGLVEGKRADDVLDHLLAKMAQVGYTRFDLGLPGNLLPVRKEDYRDRSRGVGGSDRDDGSDGFQIYENGGATHCHAYWLVEALYRQGRREDARRIYYPMLETFKTGGFQGFDPHGRSPDWRSWMGECHGYEGFLSDGYLALLAVEDDLKKAEGGKH